MVWELRVTTMVNQVLIVLFQSVGDFVIVLNYVNGSSTKLVPVSFCNEEQARASFCDYA